jgi:hypothetical protein
MMAIITIGTKRTRTIPVRNNPEKSSPMMRPHPAYSGPDMPSRRIRQKCTAMNKLAISGKKMQCRM